MEVLFFYFAASQQNPPKNAGSPYPKPKFSWVAAGSVSNSWHICSAKKRRSNIHPCLRRGNSYRSPTHVPFLYNEVIKNDGRFFLVMIYACLELAMKGWNRNQTCSSLMRIGLLVGKTAELFQEWLVEVTCGDSNTNCNLWIVEMGR